MEGWRAPKRLRSLTNSAAKFAYRVPQQTAAAAVAYLLFPGAVTVNTTITIDEMTYRLNPGLSQQNDVNAGTGTAPEFVANNLLAALSLGNNTGAGAGTQYNATTMQNPAVGYQGPGTTSQVVYGPWGVALMVVAQSTGAWGNNVPVSVGNGGGTPPIWVTDPVSLTPATTLTGGSNTVLANNAIISPSSWIELLDPDSTVVRSQVLNDAYNRFYISSPSQQPQYNTATRIGAGQPAFKLGINPPTVAPGVSTTGGGSSYEKPVPNGAASTRNISGNLVWLQPVFVTANGTLQSIQFVPNSTDPSVQFAGVIYGDAGPGTQASGFTLPGGLLGVGSIVTGMTQSNTSTSQFATPIAVQAGQFYWLGILATTLESYNITGGTNSYQFQNTFTNGPPGFAPTTGTSGVPNIYLWGVFETDDVFESRSYVYTWISAYGEESAPSPFTNFTGWTNAAWALTFAPPPPLDEGVDRNLVTTRIYRTITSTNGQTNYFWVTDVPITQLAYTDNAPDNVIAENITLPSTNYFPPPTGLQGLTLMLNGMMAGFVGNQVYLCQPYLPHAWPPANVINVDFPIIGLGFTNGALVVCTQANPYVLSGANPSVMTVTKCQLPAPCLSRASIIATDLGVYYMSQNGLIQVTNLAQATDVTELWITREKWTQLVPTTLGSPRAVPVATMYFCYGSNAAQTGVLPAGNSPPAANGFALELQTDNTSFTIWPQPGGHRVGFTQLAPPNGAYVDNLLVDPWTGIALVIQNGGVYYYDFTDQTPLMQPYVYASKIFQQNNKKNFAAMRVYFTVPANTPAQNATTNTKPFADPSWNSLQTGQYGIVAVYADVDGGDMQLVTVREIRKSGGLLRLAGGFKAESWQVQVTARVPISNIQMATTVKELGNV